ncbi:MAG: pyruvate, water dikinase regulatory protein [Pseudoxanthomonas suwonensis]|nr:pyruvate, water dikinase regulatory protein [Pseudoxanthomonas suwonensis]
MSDARPVYFVSDGTGITAETIGHALLTQFNGIDFRTDRLPFVDGPERAREVAGVIRAGGEAAGMKPVVINTCMDPELSSIIAESGALVLDVFEPFIAPLEQELGIARQPRVGRAHGIADFDSYHKRINAMNFALNHDDGISLDYDDADVILVAVSRAGKTPTCVYLALHHGVRAANYPLTDDDLDSQRLPPKLRAHRHKLFGLTIDPVRLAQIREERRPGSRYAKLETCRREVADAETMLRMEGIPTLSTTNASIEEIASRLLETLGINREMF